jgi:(p)ppGpp synthase/HD superfamily hydrolase
MPKRYALQYKNGATEERFRCLVKFTKKLENSETNADFVEDFKMNLYSKEIYLPKGNKIIAQIHHLILLLVFTLK